MHKKKKPKGNKERQIQFNENFVTNHSSTSSNGKSVFNTDLCRTLIKAYIPKLKNSTFKFFFWKNTPDMVFPKKHTSKKLR